MDRLFKTHGPRADAVRHKLDRLLLDVGERGLVEVANQMRRHTEDGCNLRAQEPPRLKILHVLRSHRQLLDRHALFEHRGAAGTTGSAERPIPRLAQPSGRFFVESFWMLDDHARRGVILKDALAVSLRQSSTAERLG